MDALGLLRKVAAAPRTPFAAQILAVADRIAAQRPIVFWTNGRAWDTCHLALELPFLNREITRRAFEDFDNPLDLRPQAARALVVNGPSGSGKTFTGNFLRLLVGLRSDQHGVAEADFATWAGQPLTPDVLAVHLAKQMGTPEVRAEAEVPRLSSQRPEWWAKDLVIWLAREASRTEKTWHLLLDNFHRPGVPAPTYIFIEQLLAALAGQPIAWDTQDPRMGPPLRLLLLGYTRPLPEQNPLVRVEDIRPITRDDLLTHFTRYYAYKGWPENAAEISDIVSRYEPRLPTLFAPVVTPLPDAVPLAPPAAPQWYMHLLAEVVLRDCAAQESRRAGVPSTSDRSPAPGIAVAAAGERENG